MVKPFSVKELLARVEAVLRRTPSGPATWRRSAFPGGTIDLARREVRFDDGRREELSDREVELVRYLAANSGRAITREEMLANVWRISPAGFPRGRSTCTSPGSARSSATTPTRRRSCRPFAGKGYMFGNEKDEMMNVKIWLAPPGSCIHQFERDLSDYVLCASRLDPDIVPCSFTMVHLGYFGWLLRFVWRSCWRRWAG